MAAKVQTSLGALGKTAQRVYDLTEKARDRVAWEGAYITFQASEDERNYTSTPALCAAIENYLPSSMANAAKKEAYRATGKVGREVAPSIARGLGTLFEDRTVSAESTGPFQNTQGRWRQATGQFISKTAALASKAKGAATAASRAIQRQLKEKELTNEANDAYNKYIDYLAQERGIRHHLRTIKTKRASNKNIAAVEREIENTTQSLLAAKYDADLKAAEAEKIGVVAGIRRYHGGKDKTRKQRRNARKQTRKH
jgi:hypothetical protein